MAAQFVATLSEADFKLLKDAYGLSLADGVEFPSPDSMILSPPPDKVGVYLKTLDASLRLPLSDFQEEVLQKIGCSIHMLTHNVVNKVVAFKMICRANDLLPDYFVFKYTFSVRRGGGRGVPSFPTRKLPKTGKMNGCGLTVVWLAMVDIGQTLLLTSTLSCFPTSSGGGGHTFFIVVDGK